MYVVLSKVHFTQELLDLLVWLAVLHASVHFNVVTKSFSCIAIFPFYFRVSCFARFTSNFKFCTSFDDNLSLNFQSRISKFKSSQLKSNIPNYLQPQKREKSPDMSCYYNAGGGCFAGHCLVEMANNEIK